MYNESSTHPVRRLILGTALTVLALALAPTLVDQYSAEAPRQVVRESAAAPVAPEVVAPEATQAPAAFSDALAVAPAGAQCSVEAHACTVPGAEGEAALSSSNETAVAYGLTRTMRGPSHNQRM